MLTKYSNVGTNIEKSILFVKVSKGAKIRNRYNQEAHLTHDTTWESNKITIIINITNKSQEVSSFQAGDHKAAMNRRKAWKTQDIITRMINNRSTALERSIKYLTLF